MDLATISRAQSLTATLTALAGGISPTPTSATDAFRLSNARGRGRDAAAALEGHGGWESASGGPWTGGMRYRAPRVVVRARVVKLKGVESQAIAAHLRYLQREGVTTDGQHGQAYSGEDDRADTRAFAERGLEDRHQFRFIVAAEDGVALGNLKPFTRQLMRQMEQDLDTALDWLAVDHFNTGQAHTHIVVRGVTDGGKILYIAGDYIAQGIRARASDLVTRQLGRQTELAVQQRLGREVDHDRFTMRRNPHCAPAAQAQLACAG
jgi:type IV secretory pathway VirD2 relaxase